MIEPKAIANMPVFAGKDRALDQDIKHYHSFGTGFQLRIAARDENCSQRNQVKMIERMERDGFSHLSGIIACWKDLLATGCIFTPIVFCGYLIAAI